MDKRIPPLPSAMILGLILCACATTEGTSPRRSLRVLAAEEIAELAVNTAHEAVELARTQWLHFRSAPSTGNPLPTPAVVYLDGLRVGDISELRRIRAAAVERMEYLSPSDATNRFGTNHGGGAILVTTR